MSDHLDDVDKPDPPLDGIERAFVADPRLAADITFDTHPNLGRFGRS